MKKLIICIIVVAIVVLGFFALNKNQEPAVDNITPEELEAQMQAAQGNNKETQNIISNFESNSNNEVELNINSAEDLTAFVDTIYAGNEELFPSLMSQAVDVTDSESVSYMTGLKNGDDLEYLVVSEPMMSSQAYSLVIAKVKDGSDADAIAKEMSENIDMRKWICVSAEVLYATSTEDLVFLVMSSEEMAKPVYEAFKSKVGKVGQEYNKAEAVEELPEDMY
ncbi:MAG: hypothetical protein IKL55_01520 [Clostridia bacterium]|nr:hypothetical protein [Clostridia bacterium]